MGIPRQEQVVGSFECDECGKKFIVQKALGGHMSVHGSGANSETRKHTNE